MKSLLKIALLLAVFSGIPGQVSSQTVPVFTDGQAQVVPAFEDPSQWLRHDLWVETSFDTDGDGLPDRMHVDVTRPAQTETEGLKLPVIYVSSPYFAGTAPFVDGLFWDVKHELGETGKPRLQIVAQHVLVEQLGER